LATFALPSLRAFGRSLLDRESIGLLLLLLATVALFAVFKTSYLRVARFHPEWLPLFFAGICLISLGFAGVRYTALHPGCSLMLRGISLSLGLYVAASWTGLGGPRDADSGTLILAVDAARYASLIAVAASMVRPSFAMIPCMYVLVSKDVTQHVLQLPWLTRTDYLPVVELGIFITFGIIAMRLVELGAQRSPLLRPSRFVRFPDARSTSVALLLIATAIHFGNYFWSAMAKMTLDGGPLVWPLANETQLLTATAYATGHLPLGHSRELSATVFSVLGEVFVPLNIVTLTVQALSVVAITRIRWAMAMTAFYDLTHIVIFLVTGIFFWKWILLNTVLLFSLRSVKETEFRPIIRVLAPLFVVGGTLVFFAARLGWYESRALNDHYFVAETEAGARYRVPTNYFLGASVTAAQQRLGSLTAPVFPTLVWATTLNNGIRRTAERECMSQPMAAKPAYAGRENQIQRFVQQHHAQITALLDRDGRFPYDWYPHHIWSNPFMFKDFNRLDKRTIVRYWYVVEAKCVDVQADRLRPVIRERHEFAIPVR
jgi:hypothetical protein